MQPSSGAAGAQGRRVAGFGNNIGKGGGPGPPGEGSVDGDDNDTGSAAEAAGAVHDVAAPEVDAPVCRFCFEEAEPRAYGGQLITPCACTGTQAHIHVRCLLTWQDTAADGAAICQVCRQKFNIPGQLWWEVVWGVFRRGIRKRATTYLLLCARLWADTAYIQYWHGADVFAALSPLHRGAHVSLALFAAFLADSEISYRHHELTVKTLFFVLNAYTFMTADTPAWVNIMRDFVSFPCLYTFCFGYLLVVDPKALFGDQARIGQGFYGTPMKGVTSMGGAAKWLEGQVLRRYGAQMARALKDAAPAVLTLGAGGMWDAPWL